MATPGCTREDDLQKRQKTREDADARTLALNASTTAAPSPPPSSFVVSCLLSSLNKVSHLASDTAFLFPDGGARFLASRAVLSTPCCARSPLLYTEETWNALSITNLTLGRRLEQFEAVLGHLVSPQWHSAGLLSS